MSRAHLDAGLSRAQIVGDLLLHAWASPPTHPNKKSNANNCNDRVRKYMGPLPRLRSIDEAMRVNDHLTAHAKDGKFGGQVGWKMGWKGAFEDEANGYRHALYAPIFTSGQLNDGDTVSLSARQLFSAEAEFGIVLKDTKAIEPRFNPYTEAEVYAYVDHMELCIELCGVRQTRSRDRLHYVADGLLGAGVVRGPSIGKPANPNRLATVPVKLFCASSKGGADVGNTLVSYGSGVNNPGDSPLASLTYLVNELCVKRGRALEGGMLVICKCF